MTLIFKFDLDIVQMYYHTKTEGSVSTASKPKQTNTHTHYENITSTTYEGGNNSYFTLSLQLPLLLIWLIIEPSYPTQMCIDTRCKYIEIAQFATYGSWRHYLPSFFQKLNYLRVICCPLDPCVSILVV